MNTPSRRSLNAVRLLDPVPAFFKSELLEPRRLFTAPPATFTRVVVSEEIALSSAVPADWDGDGDIDLLGTDSASNSFTLLVQQPDHSFIVRNAGSSANPASFASYDAADLNGDAHPDLLRTSQVGGDHRLVWQLNDGSGVLATSKFKSLPAALGRLTAADLDRDGYLDVMIPLLGSFQTLNFMAIMINDGNGGFRDPFLVNGVGTDTVHSVAAGDFDADGDIDVAVPTWNGSASPAYLQIVRNDGTAGFTLGATVLMPFGSGVAHSSVAATDIEDDGDIDLVVSTGFFGTGSDVALLRNDGTGSFVIVDVQGLNAFTWGIHASDLNGDSSADVVFGERLGLGWNDGSGNLIAGAELVARSAYGQPPIDINADGRRDIVDFSTGSAVFFGGGYEDVLAPVASRPRHFVSPQGGPPLLSIDFSEPVTAAGSLASPVLSVVNLSTGVPLDPSELRATPDAGDIYIWRLPRNLPDGNYRATLDAENTVDVAGNPLAEDFTFDFFAFAGDANRDRAVDINDFAILASRFHQPGTFSQGDFTYDGVINIGDFAVMASKFNTTLPVPAVNRVGETRSLAVRTNFSGVRAIDLVDDGLSGLDRDYDREKQSNL